MTKIPLKFKVLFLASVIISLMAGAYISAQSQGTDLGNLKTTSPALVIAYDKINLFDAWDAVNNFPLSTTTIGIVDTGIDARNGRHPEFEGVDFGRSSPFSLRDRAVEFRDDLIAGHGTGVAGIIGANNLSATQILPSDSPQMNGIISGVTDKYILESRAPVFVVSLAGFGGIVDNMPDQIVINMSVGAKSKAEDFEPTTKYFSQIFSRNPDKTFIIAGGNDDTDVQESIPANINLDNTIIVAATDLNDERADFGFLKGASNFGIGADIAAPGINVYAPAIRGKGNFPALGTEAKNYITTFGGTSASAPMVTGVAGLLKAIKSDLTPFQIKNILTQTADPIQTGETNKRIGTACYVDPNDSINTGCRLNAKRAAEVILLINEVGYDFASDFISINGNINSVSGCSINRQNQTVSFFDDFNDNKLDQGCTSNFLQFGKFQEENSFLIMKGPNGIIRNSSLVHVIQFNQRLKDQSGSFEVITHFRPTETSPFPNSTIYATFFTDAIALPFLPGLSIQVVTSEADRTLIVAGRNADPGRIFIAEEINIQSLQNLIFKVNFNDSTNMITPFFSLDNGLTFQEWKKSDNTTFRVPFFTQSTQAVYQVTGQARIPPNPNPNPFTLTEAFISGTNTKVTLPISDGIGIIE